jgi:hypothetical protein
MKFNEQCWSREHRFGIGREGLTEARRSDPHAGRLPRP